MFADELGCSDSIAGEQIGVAIEDLQYSTRFVGFRMKPITIRIGAPQDSQLVSRPDGASWTHLFMPLTARWAVDVRCIPSQHDNGYDESVNVRASEYENPLDQSCSWDPSPTQLENRAPFSLFSFN